MTRKREAASGRPRAEAGSAIAIRGKGTRFLFIVPAIMAVVLALPDFKFPYLSDDFDFLYSAQTFRPAMLLPSSDVIFYRPLSRELYFSVLNAVGGANPFVGHLLNSAVLAAGVLLLILVVTDLLGRRAAVLAGVIFAGFGQLPFLVGFVGGIQDLMAITLFLLALHLALRSKTVGAIAVFGLSLLAKETVVVLVPILMIVPWIRSGYRWPGWVPAAGYAVVLALWLAIHPGIRMFGTRQAEASSADYIGVYAGTALTKVLASLRTVLNLAPSGRAPVWPDDLSVVFVLALGLLAAAFWIFSRRRWLSEPLPMSMPWVVAIGTYTVVVPAVATAVFVRQWSPYYLCVSAMGVAILVGAALRRSGWRLAATVAMVWLTIGVWSRGDRSMSPTVSTERTFATSGQELKVVEQGFRQLRPSFPSNSRIYVSIMGLRLGDVRNALERYQCLRVWYQDPSLRTADPLNPIQGNGPEFQFVVRKGPVVDEVVFHEGNAGNPSSIDVVLGAPSSSTLGVALAIRNRAMGLATVGDVDRAVEMLLSLPIPAYRTFHWRLAGVFLLAAGRAAEAEALVARSPMQSPGDAASYLYLYFIHTQGSRFDDAAFPCFGVSPRDAGTLRSLRIRLEEEGYVDGALRCARRLAALLPESSEARADVERLERAPENDRVTRRADE